MTDDDIEDDVAEIYESEFGGEGSEIGPEANAPDDPFAILSPNGATPIDQMEGLVGWIQNRFDVERVETENGGDEWYISRPDDTEAPEQ